MASSPEDTMTRLSRLETDVGEIKGALVHISGILLSHGERLDTLGHRVDALGDRVDALGHRVDALGDRVDALGDRMDAGFRTLNTTQQSMVERLDRLIEVTIKERTYSAERFGDVERRLTRLEEHVGLPKS
jgi:hypothetical protein